MTAIPITSEGRASCGLCHANKLTQIQIRCGTLAERTRGVADKECHGSERRTEEPENTQLILQRWLRLHTLFSAGKKTQKTINYTSLWESSFPMRTIMPRQLLPFQKCHKTFFEKYCWKLLIVPFVLSFHNFFFFSVTVSTLAGIPEYHHVYFGSSSCVGWQQWEEVSFDWHKIEICQGRLFFFFLNSQAFPLVHIPLCGFTCECIC